MENKNNSIHRWRNMFLAIIPWLAEKTEMLYVYGMVTAENVFLCICVVHMEVIIYFI